MTTSDEDVAAVMGTFDGHITTCKSWPPPASCMGDLVHAIKLALLHERQRTLLQAQHLARTGPQSMAIIVNELLSEVQTEIAGMEVTT